MKILVLHNVGHGMFWEYISDKAQLHHAHTFEIPAHYPPIVVTHTASWIFELCNVDPDMLQVEEEVKQVEHYRNRRNRSLSVSDVIIFMNGEAPVIALACQRSEWEPLSDEERDRILAETDLSDVDNHLDVSLAWHAHQPLYDNPPNPFVS